LFHDPVRPASLCDRKSRVMVAILIGFPPARRLGTSALKPQAPPGLETEVMPFWPRLFITAVQTLSQHYRALARNSQGQQNQLNAVPVHPTHPGRRNSVRPVAVFCPVGVLARCIARATAASDEDTPLGQRPWEVPQTEGCGVASTLRPLLMGITFVVFFNREGYLVPERHTMERNSQDGNGDTDSGQNPSLSDIRLSDTDRLEGLSDGVFGGLRRMQGP
jgi:hypothetical protein